MYFRFSDLYKGEDPLCVAKLLCQNEVFADSFSVSGHTNKHVNIERVVCGATTYAKINYCL
jgi:hypothetical protein